MDPLKVCTKFQVSSTSQSLKRLVVVVVAGAAALGKSRGSNLISNSSRTNDKHIELTDYTWINAVYILWTIQWLIVLLIIVSIIFGSTGI